jgi:demethylspheroidene O-methyltransferase
VKEAFYRWRDRLLADPGFQRWSARFPLTRGLARRKAAAVFDIAAGFVYSQVLTACVKLGLLDSLADGPKAVSWIAEECGLEPEAAERLCEAAAAIDLLQRRGRGFGLGELGAAVRGNPGIPAMVAHNQCLYRDLQDPIALLRRETDTELATFWPYASGTSGDVQDYSELMSTSQSLVAEDILDAYPMDRHTHLWDIAGGNGTFAISALSRHPGLTATVLDLPPVAKLARDHFSRTGLSERATAVSGNMFEDPLQGQQPDLVSLVRVVHDHDDGPVMTLFRSLRAGMRQGSVLLVAEPMAESPGAKPMGHTYFGLYLWAMGSGRPRSARELKQMLGEAGFRHCKEIRTYRPLMVRVLAARV